MEEAEPFEGGEVTGQIVVSPKLFSVDPSDIERLETVRPVPEVLKQFWLVRGCGLYRYGLDGETPVTDFRNEILDPEFIYNMMVEWVLIDPDDFNHGFPFFNICDHEFLFLDPDGQVIDVRGDDTIVISPSFDSFLEKLAREPEFYLEFATDGFDFERSTVKPLLSAVDEEIIESLEKLMYVNFHLTDFWRNRGAGSFVFGSDGRALTSNKNNLLTPDQIARLLKDDKEKAFERGLPFFEYRENEYLLLEHVSYFVVKPNSTERMVSGGFDCFIQRLLDDPEFYMASLA